MGCDVCGVSGWGVCVGGGRCVCVCVVCVVCGV